MEIMANKELAVGPEVPEKHKSDAVEVENRSYNLDTSKAMMKKLRAADDDMFTMRKTGGGIRYKFNAGMYELLKEAASDFYLEFQSQNKCTKTVVNDKKGNVVEVKYRQDVADDTHYTLNMYHTTSSCLVNGKGCTQFVETDIYEIFDAIVKKLQTNRPIQSEGKKYDN